MIPQGYPLQIRVLDESWTRYYFVIGWRDYGTTLRPVVVERGSDNNLRAVTLPAETKWSVSYM
jgi:hypothetical protein